MTCCSVTDLHVIPAFFPKPELVIKSSDAIDFVQRDVHVTADFLDGNI